MLTLEQMEMIRDKALSIGVQLLLPLGCEFHAKPVVAAGGGIPALPDARRHVCIQWQVVARNKLQGACIEHLP